MEKYCKNCGCIIERIVERKWARYFHLEPAEKEGKFYPIRKCVCGCNKPQPKN